jgi:hypothetical protein
LHGRCRDDTQDAEAKMICHPHDQKWIDEQLGLLPSPMRNKIADKYSQTYQGIIDAHAGEIAAESLARREANTRLRLCVERFGSAYHGAVVAPDCIK